MKLAFSFKEGILEYTARVLVESCLSGVEFCDNENAEYIIVFNKCLSYGRENEICVFKEDNDSDFLVRVFKTVKNQFSDDLVSVGLDNLEWFAKSFYKCESSDLISDVVLGYREYGIDVNDMSKDELTAMLKNNVRFTSSVDELLGVKLHLYINHNKLKSYYKWLTYKFQNLHMFTYYKCGKKFFTRSEVDSFYRSLASKIRHINKILENCTIEVIERHNELIDGKETIYVIEVKSINRALNEVILKSEGVNNLIVCCKSNDTGLYSFWKGKGIEHKIISNRSKVERVVEYIEPLGSED